MYGRSSFKNLQLGTVSHMLCIDDVQDNVQHDNNNLPLLVLCLVQLGLED